MFKLKNVGAKHHILLPIMVISLIAAAGSYALLRSQAETVSDEVKYKIASYNILGSGANATPDFNRKYNTNTQERMNHATKVMREFDIVGVQELDFYKEDRFKKNQFYMFKDELADEYGIFPRESRVSSNRSLNFDKTSMRAIFWKRDKFQVIDKGEVAYPYQNAPRLANGEFERNDKAPWVLLQDKANPSIKFYVINTHLIAFNTKNCRWNCNPPTEPRGSDQYGDQKRKAGAEIFRDWVIEKKKRHPVLVTGDFNSGVQIKHKESPVERPGLPYCVLTDNRGGNQVLRNTMDSFLNRKGQCPTTNNEKYRFIDHIYATQSFTVRNWFKKGGRDVEKASDHRPTVAVVSLKLPQPTDPPLEEAGEYPDVPLTVEPEEYKPDPDSLIED